MARRIAIHCIGSLCATAPAAPASHGKAPAARKSGGRGGPSGASGDADAGALLDALFTLLLPSLQSDQPPTTVAASKLLGTTMQTLQFVATRRGSVPDAVLPPLLAALKVYMLYGLPAAAADEDFDAAAGYSRRGYPLFHHRDVTA